MAITPTIHTECSCRDIIENYDKVSSTRFEAMDKAIHLLQEAANRQPTINEVFLSHEEKFKSIEVQFAERDKLRELVARAAHDAITAALDCQKEAVAQQNLSFSTASTKSELAVTKLIDSLGQQLAGSVSSLQERTNDLKERIVLIEGTDKGADHHKNDTRSLVTIIIAASGLILGALSMVIVLIKGG